MLEGPAQWQGLASEETCHQTRYASQVILWGQVMAKVAFWLLITDVYNLPWDNTDHSYISSKNLEWPFFGSIPVACTEECTYSLGVEI